MIVSVIIFRNSEGKILLQFRDGNAKSCPLRFSLFGGMAEGEESATEAVIREVKEELDIDLTPDDVHLHGEVPWVGSDGRDKTVAFFEAIKPLEWGFQIYEGAGAAFLTKEEIARMDCASELAKHMVREYC